MESVPNTIILTQGLNSELLWFPLHIWYCPTLLQRGVPVNHAIVCIMSGAVQKPWCGSVVMLKFNGLQCQGYSDAGTSDLPVLSAYFLEYNILKMGEDKSKGIYWLNIDTTTRENEQHSLLTAAHTTMHKWEKDSEGLSKKVEVLEQPQSPLVSRRQW
ncbi:hypothetical protein V8D89_004245 [Ganoderma adspersum]